MLQQSLKNGSQGIVNIGVTVGGTWQRRGYTAINGVVVAMSIDSGKILGIEPLSRYCKSCNTMSRTLKNNPQMFEEWKKIRQESCKVNYSGTAPAMEVEGGKRMFERSIVKRNLRYTSYYGD